MEQSAYDSESWLVRSKLTRMGLSDRREATRAVQRLQLVGIKAPPTVWTATFSFIANRWCTRRNQGTRNSKCLLGCGEGPDACHHYRECRIVWGFLRNYLQVGPGCPAAGPFGALRPRRMRTRSGSHTTGSKSPSATTPPCGPRMLSG